MTSRKRSIIAVTGSAGKTTTKEMIASVLGVRWRIVKTQSNWNQPRATARSAKRIKPYHRAAVLEYGMLRNGQIRAHCKALQPTIGVITNVGTAHIGNVGNRVEGIAKAKSELIRYMKPSGLLVLNADDRNSRLLAYRNFKGRLVKVGIRNRADYRAHGITAGRRGVRFRVKLDGKDEAFAIPCLGEHNVYNALNAIAVTHRLGFKAGEIRKGLARYPVPYRRLVRTELPRAITLIDDTFSSNPTATKAALDVLAQAGRSRTYAVVGHMKDLGRYSAKGHKDVGAYAARKKVSRLYAIGKHARYIVHGARAAGLPAGRIRLFQTREGLHRALIADIKPGAAILVKGTHLLKLERTVAFLKKRLSAKIK
ncbi:UDP-N-acetylmuramoyl-tripeptide--D-alanyl-D-alanine ligase [Paenibacillus humicola]|uniref:UDP-N-acetylmuramoyl-tripeptide--D-alanyl-D- alanine ligase n=1 Tax=Paenibacillus humicola TaxID=3110540 RepID=UPI00237BE8A0|nr:UDP-N-acetylmuramoyl-tripeptide--D-alanyl-D-alanine ligase [Paenibacillus humicola]